MVVSLPKPLGKDRTGREKEINAREEVSTGKGFLVNILFRYLFLLSL